MRRAGGFTYGLLNGQLSSAARIAALRRWAPEESPRVPTLIAAELPILVVEAMLAALTSFTLVGPLGLPWWLPLVCVAVIAGLSVALRGVALAQGRWLKQGGAKAAWENPPAAIPRLSGLPKDFVSESGTAPDDMSDERFHRP